MSLRALIFFIGFLIGFSPEDSVREFLGTPFFGHFLRALKWVRKLFVRDFYPTGERFVTPGSRKTHINMWGYTSQHYFKKTLLRAPQIWEIRGGANGEKWAGKEETRNEYLLSLLLSSLSSCCRGGNTSVSSTHLRVEADCHESHHKNSVHMELRPRRR